MVIKPKKLKDVFEIYLEPIEDKRGFFMRTYDKTIFQNHGIDIEWVQENHSKSETNGIIRGLHFQFPPYIETKLIRVVKGEIFDVFVDLRKYSPTFGQWDSIKLSELNHKMILVPKGFAHGFCTLTDDCEVIYKVDNYYTPHAEGGIIWNDETLNINWPTNKPLLSTKDTSLIPLNEFISKYVGL